jgi:hypothetical protein
MKNIYKTDYIRTAKQLVIAISIVTLIVLWISQLFPKAEASEFWTKKTQEKYEKVIALGFNKEFTKTLFEECKQTAIDPTRCIKIWLSIFWAESTGWKNCTYNNCMGLGNFRYKTMREWVQDWVTRYGTWWYKQKNPSSFYNNIKWKQSITNYCYSEEDTNIEWYCPKWFTNSWSMFNKLTFLK